MRGWAARGERNDPVSVRVEHRKMERGKEGGELEGWVVQREGAHRGQIDEVDPSALAPQLMRSQANKF